MHRILALVAVVIAVGMGCTASAEGDDALIVKESSADFTTTVERLQAEIEERGAKIAATVDHAAAAEASGLDLRPTTVIIFGNPQLGTPLMQSQQTTGLDLPLRVLVWEDAEEKVQIGYWPPAQIAELHGIEDRDEVTGEMAGALDAITGAATGR